jgi:hypothetical protein
VLELVVVDDDVVECALAAASSGFVQDDAVAGSDDAAHLLGGGNSYNGCVGGLVADVGVVGADGGNGVLAAWSTESVDDAIESQSDEALERGDCIGDSTNGERGGGVVIVVLL